MNCILIGYGEIGQGIHTVFGKHHNIDICDIDPKYTYVPSTDKYDIMLVAIPYTDRFIEIVKEYQMVFKTKATIIFSTVPIGTTREIDSAVHAPIEGCHPKLSQSIDRWDIFMGGWNQVAYKFFEPCKAPIILDKPEFSEFLKLQSTSNYGLMLEYARYLKTVADKIGMDERYINLYNAAYNELYLWLGMRQFQRYLLTAPEGNIGGHCVVPNAKLLDKQFPSVFLKEVYRDKEGKDG